MLKSLNKRTKIILVCILFCYILIFVNDFSLQSTGNKYLMVVKYFSILLCFILTIMIEKNGHDILDTRMLQSGLFFTVCADYCLVVSNKFILGVEIFCIVQIIYIFRFTRDLKSKTKIFSTILIIYIILSITAFTAYKVVKFDLRLILICIFYGCLITTSLIAGIRTLKTNYFSLYSSVLISIGMIMFFMCDINVALFNILQKSGSYFANIPRFFIWIFYLPAQVMLALSGYNHRKK